ncbi:MAG TPA: glutamate synthase [candidate division Zixibacteria bacterium]|nr:glutamate synthase [candidate division Zixibacteria bacterium]
MDKNTHSPLVSNKYPVTIGANSPIRENVAEGGCGVLGIASSIPIQGRYLLQPLIQMHNRGNGKGGGIAAVGLSAKQLGVSERVLEEDYIMQVAYIDPKSRGEVESQFINSNLNVELAEKIPTIENHRSIGLEVKPPEVWRYLVRAKEDKLRSFVEKNGYEGLKPEAAEDEFIYRNSFALNKKYYASLGDKKAFVLSHGKNIIVFKIVGYAEQVLHYYRLEDLESHVWVGHQRYPTKGKIWHPGGSHPFIGLHDALVHNGDFANYHSITEYLRQRNISPLFLTDTEVAALYWDLLTRTYEYPLEYAIEAIAPTTERDFALLPEDKKKIYKAVQATHIHCSPDGPWFFIIARNNPYRREFQLIGITDTSMLRPQVFSLQEGEAKIGFIASEKQAIDTMVQSLAKDDSRFYSMSDLYWYARGGSYTDGGAFVFTVDESKNLLCTDKFGKPISAKNHQQHYKRMSSHNLPRFPSIHEKLKENPRGVELFAYAAKNIEGWSFGEVCSFAETIREYADKGDEEKSVVVETLTLLIDRRYDTGRKRRSDIVSLFEEKLFDVFNSTRSTESDANGKYRLIKFEERNRLKGPADSSQTLVMDVSEFPPEGREGTCQLLERACKLGWKNFVAYNFRGQRNFGAGLIARDRVRIDVYGRVGDCLAAFADGPEFYVHESAQDSVAYCFRSGKLVIYGDAGKAFEYGAKGGVTFILGDLIDRPLINSVGSATAVVNGSCKDYMGESCMAARGFTILNGVAFDDHGKMVEQETPYPGGNLFPLAAASAVYLRDPRETVGEDQLNGGKITTISKEDWERILPLLKENEKLFGYGVEGLLKVDGVMRRPECVYRKVVPVEIAALAKYESGI